MRRKREQLQTKWTQYAPSEKKQCNQVADTRKSTSQNHCHEVLVPSLATPATVQARTHESRIPSQTFGMEGREVAAPPWSAACMTDHGPSQCDEPMWVYGSPDYVARFKNAF